MASETLAKVYSGLVGTNAAQADKMMDVLGVPAAQAQPAPAAQPVTNPAPVAQPTAAPVVGTAAPPAPRVVDGTGSFGLAAGRPTLPAVATGANRQTLVDVATGPQAGAATADQPAAAAGPRTVSSSGDGWHGSITLSDTSATPYTGFGMAGESTRAQRQSAAAAEAGMLSDKGLSIGAPGSADEANILLAKHQYMATHPGLGSPDLDKIGVWAPATDGRAARFVPFGMGLGDYKSTPPPPPRPEITTQSFRNNRPGIQADGSIGMVEGPPIVKYYNPAFGDKGFDSEAEARMGLDAKTIAALAQATNNQASADETRAKIPGIAPAAEAALGLVGAQTKYYNGREALTDAQSQLAEAKARLADAQTMDVPNKGRLTTKVTPGDPILGVEPMVTVTDNATKEVTTYPMSATMNGEAKKFAAGDDAAQKALLRKKSAALPKEAQAALSELGEMDNTNMYYALLAAEAKYKKKK